MWHLQRFALGKKQEARGNSLWYLRWGSNENPLSQEGLRAIFIPCLSLILPVILTPASLAQTPMDEPSFIPLRPNPEQFCPQEPAIDRFIYHTISPGESLSQIAANHQLMPSTLMGLNRSLRNGQAPVGTQIVIPPYDGVLVRIPVGKTWRDVAEAYRVPADALFEVNGCQQNPEMVFVPGVNWSPGRPSREMRTQLSAYPLPAVAPLLKGYGWYLNSQTSRREFSSGVDIRAPIGTPVSAVGDGIVAYAGDRASYGQLVVINHPGGRQTRYAHLQTIQVSPGQNIRQGDVLGTVGTTGNPQFSIPHLHFEMRYKSAVGWVAEDPGLYIQELGQNLRY
ncbi:MULTISPECIES: M23 family metallopeptidase [unclassified Roseofilum]|uniref:M23 family metallopeptidase n=1 Tax=unclassified Roseofilum TaxID=2620099 RepID=UPI000E7D6843|nr:MULTISPECIES: M23 family metallopeptidase [unclassified Roseofilum]MBP0010969.1 M23 family metallopeptidase [Roseofilum sp. Belize Diploria]MBP0035376.1 M23 family metallopeptidase [Roseofilum sp. Belize BBD 4]HBQ97237.1 peptidase [Cyanobacteria bacterium UBA11691]